MRSKKNLLVDDIQPRNNNRKVSKGFNGGIASNRVVQKHAAKFDRKETSLVEIDLDTPLSEGEGYTDDDRVGRYEREVRVGGYNDEIKGTYTDALNFQEKGDNIGSKDINHFDRCDTTTYESGRINCFTNNNHSANVTISGKLQPSLFKYDLEGDVAVDPHFDDSLGFLYECSSSHYDSVDPNWFRDESNHKARNITDALSFVKKLGHGVYGDVFLCHLRDDPTKQFAVKRVRQAPTPVENIFGLEQNIIKELHALRSLKRPHVNIVRLYDYCSAIENYTSKNSDTASKTCIVFYLIFELCDMDLNQFVKEVASKYKPHEIDLLTSAIQHSDGNDCKIQDLINHSQTYYIKNRHNKDKIPLPALGEDAAKVIMYQLLQGLAYLHSNRIIHRDIKPQNILLKKNSNSIIDDSPYYSWKVKIGDLGLSTVIPARYLSLMTEEVVTLLYRPPELLLGDCKYTTAVDIWSTATTVGECMLGKPMFRGRTEFSVLMRIISTIGTPSPSEIPQLSKELKYLTEEIPNISRDIYDTLRKMFTDHFGRQLLSDCGLDLFVKMLQFIPKNRITADEALRHPWFDNINSLLKPSIAKCYLNNTRLFPKGYKDMLPLVFLGDVEEFNKKLKDKKNKWNNVTIDDYITQFTFP